MNRIGQFWYTSAPASAGRSAGFQVVATSPGLSDLTRKAIRLCRYDRPEGLASDEDRDAPVSFGWLDFEGLRFCFRRTPAGADHYGRPGNFAAHILIGPPRLLRATDIAGSYGSSSWWGGGLADGLTELPELENLRSFKGTKLPAVPAELLAHFLDALLGRKSRRLVSVVGDPATLAALVKAAERAAGGLMDAHSLSTHEGAETARWFDIVGGAGDGSGIVVSPSREPAVSESATRARSLLLADRSDPRNKRIVELAVKAAELKAGEPDVPAFADLLVAYSDLDAGRPPDTALLVRILSKPVAEDTLLTYDRACHEVAAELIAGRPDIAAALSTGFTRKVGERLGRSAARLLVGGTPPEQWDQAIGSLGGPDGMLGGACLHALVEESRAKPELLNHISADLHVRLLRVAAKQNTPSSDPAVSRLLSSLGDCWEPVAFHAKLPHRYRAIALASAQRLADPAAVARMLLADSGLACEFAAQDPAIRLIVQVLEGAPKGQGPVLVRSMAPALTPGSRAELLRYTVPRIRSAKSKLNFLLECEQEQILPAADQAWTDIVTAAYAATVSEQLDQWRIPEITKFADSLLHWCGDAKASAWLDIGAIVRSEHVGVEALAMALEASARIEPVQEQGVAVLASACYFAAHRPNAADFRVAVAAVDKHGFLGIEAMAFACQMVKRTKRDEVPAQEFLLGLLDMARLGSFAQADHGEGLAKAAGLVRGLSAELREGLLELADELEPQVADWWLQLNGQRSSGVGRLLRRLRFRGDR